MLSPRWRKVIRELWYNRTRTLLVVLSIGVGVMAVGTVAGTYTVVTRELPAGYARINPASTRIYTEPFDGELVDVIRNVPGVAAAEGRRSVTMRLEVGPDQWRDIEIFALSDFNDIEVAKIWPERGDWPPSYKELLIERSAVDLIGARIGETVVIEAPSGSRRTMRIGGLAHDINQPSAQFVGSVYGYVTADTMRWLGIEGDFNELSIVVSGNKSDRDHISAVASAVRSKVEKSGRTVFWLSIPEPGKHPAEQLVQPMALLLGVLGLLSVLLSSFLVINTITALLAQQTRQIGVMKAVGARTRQIMGLYLIFVILLGLLAFLVSVPTALLAIRWLSGLLARLINFDIASYRPSASVIGLQAITSLLVPLVASLVPVRKGARLTVREAINSYGIAAGTEGARLTDRVISKVRGVSRPVLLSLRNTFRRKGRLALTLITLGLASTIFVAVGSVRASLLTTLDDAIEFWQYDIGVSFVRPYRVEEIERIALEVPGVKNAESWGYQSVRRLRPDNTDSENIIMIAPPANTELLQPTVLAGRWLLPEDENAIVLTTDLVRAEPGLEVGQMVDLEIDGRTTSWLVVGLIRGVLSGPTLYANYPYFARVVRSLSRASSVQVVVEDRSSANLQVMAAALEDQFEANSLRVGSTNTLDDLRQIAISQFAVIIVFLVAMAILLAIVGALGLMGTMSINVLERTKEIGIMRAIGATGRAVRQIVVVEGGLIGVLSWSLGALASLPISRLLSDRVGDSFLQAPLSYTFSATGAGFWLVAVVVLAVVASLWPARNASRLSVRDVLAYE